ncbi:MAG TPA: hypothetical protein ACFYD3_00780 [Candidatus Hypogeohydataceae bacterium YC41]
MENSLRLLLFALAAFDFILANGIIFSCRLLPEKILSMPHLEPRFFMLCCGLFLYQYTYIQYMGFRNPSRYATCLNLTVCIRLTAPILYITGILLWGAPFTLFHWMFAASAVVDLTVSAFILSGMRRLNIPFFKGDATAVEYSKGPELLRKVLLILTIGEFLISMNFILVPKFWLNFFGIPFTVDPWWTRMTGLFLLNIAYIQYLGYLDVYRYSQAVAVSGYYRALWPGLYWYWVFSGGAGNAMFKGFILFFSFFNIFTCIFILWSLRRALSQPAPERPATGNP